ncbi:hypothetical protein [Azospirillum halopraeferens]|uniref:hypothetical protein n=1 Tax=Azospirillum halopraeferens TaxID=34010 RepID=UPI000491D4B8|nr:hypothetical protein [Azospirillum halopraeferens]
MAAHLRFSNTEATMCAGADGCFLIRAYHQSAARHGHDEAVRRAADLYRRTNRDATPDEAVAFVERFVQPSAVPACAACG